MTNDKRLVTNRKPRAKGAESVNRSSSVTTRRSKVARLPLATREKINTMLDDGAAADDIIKSLNLARHDDTSKNITPQNISGWRLTGYLDDQRRRERVEATRSLEKYALDLAKAGGNLTEGAAAIAGGKILALLETASDDDVGGLVKSLATLRGDDIKRATLANKERELALSEQRFQRETAKLFIEWSESPDALKLVKGKEPRRAKVENLVKLFFGERPEHLKKPLKI